jgi:hypothetical protein
MKILVEHDQEGKIRSVAVPGKGPNQLTLRPRPNHHIAEVEAPSVKDEQDAKNLSQIRKAFRVEGRHPAARLVR